jgi:hypothetical protein
MAEMAESMPGMADDQSAMQHPNVEAMSSSVASQSCQPNCVTAERLLVSRKVVPEVTAVQSGAVVLDTTAKFVTSHLAAAWSSDGDPPTPPIAYAAVFSILRV